LATETHICGSRRSSVHRHWWRTAGLPVLLGFYQVCIIGAILENFSVRGDVRGQ
jgi:hypothetical protein